MTTSTRPAPRPFLIRKDGTLVDRATDTSIGRVYIDGGWLAQTPWGDFRAHARYLAARRAWDAWRRATTQS